ncbi:MAG: PilW family protein [Burkholderiaceae bacterium]|nr:PilW family protein [Burkholderiaceae bacterium]
MKTNNIIHYKSKLAGRSLVELMIAITIGLFILIAVSALFLSNSQTSRTSDDKSRLEDEGRLALNLIAFHLRMAGYGALISADKNPLALSYGTTFTKPIGFAVGAAGPDPVQGCAGGFANPAAAVIACAGGTTSDALSIRYVIDLFNANVTSTGIPAPTDCLGQRITAVSSIVENRFFIKNNATTGRSELYCIGNGNTSDGADFTGAAQPIAENIIDLRLTYGTSSTSGQSVDGAFVDANGVGVAWGNVLAVNVCLVGQSANDGVAARPQQYRDCAGQLITAPDRRLYSTFSTVVTLRSKV